MRKQEFKMLRESEEKYRRLNDFNQRILDNAPVSIMVIDTSGKITAVNKYFANFGRTEDPVGRLISEVNFFKREKLVESYHELFKTGQPFSRIDCRTVNRKGETKFINILAVPLRSPNGEIEGAISMASDNTEMHNSRDKLIELNRNLEKEVIERRIAEKEIKILSEINQKILDNVPVSTIMVEKSGEILAGNKAALELLEQPKKSIQGQKLFERKEFIGNKELIGMFENLFETGQPFYYDDFNYFKEGSGIFKHLNISVAPLMDDHNRVEGAILMATDNTEAAEAKNNLKKMSEELERKVKESTYELKEINRRLTDILDLKSKFVADASHELRTPLTVIRGNLDLAIMSVKREGGETPELYSLILDEVERMRLVLSDLAIITKDESDKSKIKYEEASLGNIVNSVLRSLRVIARDKDVLLEREGASEDVKIAGDAVKLEKLISNIIRNAIKYTDPGGYIKVGIKKEKDEALIIIEDSGIGIPEEDLPHIFERFYRVDKARIRDESGSGLGLSIAKLIADDHGGSICAESELGRGSTFTVRLPLDCREKRKNLNLFAEMEKIT